VVQTVIAILTVTGISSMSAGFFTQLERDIQQDEGYRAHPYFDSLGVATIGYGTTKIDGMPVRPSTDSISREQAAILCRADIYEALIGAETIIPNFYALDAVRRAVLVNMVYNLGLTRFMGFKRLIAAVTEDKYLEAGREMVDSAWFNQVGLRSRRLRKEMVSGIHSTQK
jgi:lysozyme